MTRLGVVQDLLGGLVLAGRELVLREALRQGVADELAGQRVGVRQDVAPARRRHLRALAAFPNLS